LRRVGDAPAQVRQLNFAALIVRQTKQAKMAMKNAIGRAGRKPHLALPAASSNSGRRSEPHVQRIRNMRRDPVEFMPSSAVFKGR
jgi:hypothetical protein